MAKAFKAWCLKPTGWEPPTLCSLHGWIGGVEQVVVLESRNHSKFRVKPEELVVERSS